MCTTNPFQCLSLSLSFSVSLSLIPSPLLSLKSVTVSSKEDKKYFFKVMTFSVLAEFEY